MMVGEMDSFKNLEDQLHLRVIIVTTRFQLLQQSVVLRASPIQTSLWAASSWPNWRR